MSKEEALKAAEAALTKVHDAEAHVVVAAPVEPVKPSDEVAPVEPVKPSDEVAPSSDIYLGPTAVGGV